MIYKYALDHLPKGRVQDVYGLYTQFEKQFGSRDGIEDVVVSKRRFQYEEVCLPFLTRVTRGRGRGRGRPPAP